jgi:hypothetical protein
MRFKGAMALAVGAALGISAGAQAYQSPVHIFSIDDVQGGFDGSTYGLSGAIQRLEIFCGLPGSPDCPTDDDGEPLVAPIVDREGVTLYPIDSQFGFYVVDFVGAQEKDYDDDYREGWAGNITDGDTVIGVKISNAETDTYKVRPPLGTWCQGLGGTSVKCSTEHYTVMEHALSCHEVIPYSFADPVTGTQGTQETPDGSLFLDCATADLDDYMEIIGSDPLERLTDSTPGEQMDANDNTSVLSDIAVSSDYSLTLKDDGKALYRWGGLIKRPNDVRMYARLALPEEWKERDAEGNLVNDFVVTKARLVVNHWITNNPNDQLRPEDLENEAATGRKPDYREEPADENSPDPSATVWRSINPCYEGDGDLIDNEEGIIDPTAIGIGTYFKNTPFAVTENTNETEPGAPPYPFSADLTGAFTNAYYTTIERDPFEWSYEIVTADGDATEHDFVGCSGPIDDPAFAALCDIDAGRPLASGPRWRLKANKFGQDIPGLEIPVIECSPPPFGRDNIKYIVGEPVTTVINLLDWNEEENGLSPLATSKGWVDSALHNPFITVVDTVNGRQITSNGLPMSEDFDLAVYVKGDRKSTAVFNAYLDIAYEGEVVPPPVVDAALSSLVSVPSRVAVEETASIVATVTNTGPDATAACEVQVTGVTNRGIGYGPYDGDCETLPVGQSQSFTFPWTAPSRPGNVTWTATVTAEGDTNPANDSATVRTQIVP